MGLELWKEVCVFLAGGGRRGDDISWGEFVQREVKRTSDRAWRNKHCGRGEEERLSGRGCSSQREAGERVWHRSPRMKGLGKQGVVSGKVAGGQGQQVPGGKCPLIQSQRGLWP